MAINYNKHSWAYGEEFTPDKLNNIENGIAANTSAINTINSNLANVKINSSIASKSVAKETDTLITQLTLTPGTYLIISTLQTNIADGGAYIQSKISKISGNNIDTLPTRVAMSGGGGCVCFASATITTNTVVGFYGWHNTQKGTPNMTVLVSIIRLS